MRSSVLAVFISANFLPHIIAIPNNSPPGIELIQDPAWGDNSWNIADRESLQEGLSANADGYDLAFANGQPQVTTPESTDTSLSDLAATPNDCKDHTQPERLRGRSQRLKRDPQKPQVCPLKIEPPEMQPSGESTETNTVPGEQPPGGPFQIPPPWLLVVPEPDWKNNPNCISKTYGLLTLGVCDSGPYPLPSSYDLHGKPNLAFSQPPTSGDPTSQPTQLGLDLNNAKAWQLSNARLVHPLDTTCGAGSGNNQFWCCKIFTPPVSKRPGKADICLTLDMISRMEANGGFQNELRPRRIDRSNI